MKYWFHDVGIVEQGKIIEVTLDQAANIRIMDEDNYNNFKNRQSYSAIIYFITTSPFKIKLPRSAHWYVVVDPEDQPGSVVSSVKVYRKSTSEKPV